MQRYEEIEKGIETRDIKRLRDALGALVFTSRDFSSGEFDEALRYIESKGIRLKDNALVGNPAVSSIKSTFTEDDFSDAVYELVENFCDERIEDVKTIGRALYGKKAEKAPGKQKAGNAPGGVPSNGGTGGESADGNRPKPNVRPNAPGQNSTELIGILAVALLAILLIILLVKLLK